MLRRVFLLIVLLSLFCNQVALGDSNALSRNKRGIFSPDIDPDMIGLVIQRNETQGVDVFCSATKVSFNVSAEFVSSLNNGALSDLVFIGEDGEEIDENCDGTYVDGGFEYCFNESFAQCASSITEQGDFIHVNYTLCFIPEYLAEDIVTRARSLTITFYCVYSKTNFLTDLDYIDPLLQKLTLDPVVDQGLFDLSIDRYTDASFSQISYSDNVTVEDKVFIKITLNDDVQDVVVQAKTCWATDSENPSTGRIYYVIENGCPAYDPYLGEANNVYQNYEEGYATFSYTSFVWNDPGNQDNQYIYLHCQLYVCSNHDENNNCTDSTTDCSSVTTGGNARKRRSIESGKIVSLGPLHVEKKINQCDKDSYGCAYDCYGSGQNGVSCFCPYGYYIGADGKSCVDISAQISNEIKPTIVYVTNPKIYYIVMVLAFAWFISIGAIASKIRSSKSKITLA